jgi:hypothetical protein
MKYGHKFKPSIPASRDYNHADTHYNHHNWNPTQHTAGKLTLNESRKNVLYSLRCIHVLGLPLLWIFPTAAPYLTQVEHSRANSLAPWLRHGEYPRQWMG